MDYSKVMVTGGSGLVGSYLQEIMPDANYVNSSNCNLLDYYDTIREVAYYQPNIVIHLAARVGGMMDNIKYPVDYFEENIIMNNNIIRASHDMKVENFIGILSSCIYPDVVEKYPMVEEQLFDGPPPSTNLAYAFAKRAMAVHIDAYNKQYSKNWSCLIPCNLYGRYDKYEDHNSHFVAALIKKIHEANDKIEMFGSGKPMRQFMFAKDLAKIIKIFVDKEMHGFYNVSSDNNMSIKKIAEIAIKACGKPNLKINFSNNGFDGQLRKDITSAKLLKEIGNFNFTSLEDGIKETYNYYIGK